MLALFKQFYDWILSLFFTQKMEMSIVGLQLSGKTTFVSVISGTTFSEDTIPTTGFNVRTLNKGRVSMKIWDIGGQPRFRPLWDRYCRNVNCIVFMVDSADFEKLDQAKTELTELLAKPLLNGIPLLVLANKCDLENAFTDQQIIARMDLESISNREVGCYSISCKNKTNLDVALKWIIDHHTTSTKPT